MIPCPDHDLSVLSGRYFGMFEYTTVSPKLILMYRFRGGDVRAFHSTSVLEQSSVIAEFNHGECLIFSPDRSSDGFL
jgi:hypothetical protein